MTLGRNRRAWLSEKTTLPYVLVTPALILMVAIVIAPLVFSLVMGWYNWSPLRQQAPTYVGLANYIKLFSDADFWYTVQISAKYVLFVVGIAVTLGFVIAMALSVDMPGIRLLRSLVILPLMLSPVVVGLMWCLLYDPRGGVINYVLGLFKLGRPLWIGDVRSALISVAIVGAWQATPFAALVLLAGLQALPIEPYEAARVDGASEWAVFRYLTLPLLRKFILLAVLFLSVDAIRAFDTIYTMTRGGPGRATEVASMYAFTLGFRAYRMGAAYAMSHVILLATVLVGLLILLGFRGGSRE